MKFLSQLKRARQTSVLPTFAFFLRLAVAASVYLCWVTAALAQSGDSATGQRFVESSCSGCHAERQIALTKNGAPTFAAMAADPTVSAFSLRAFLETAHARMPNFILSRDQIDDVISYILKLRER